MKKLQIFRNLIITSVSVLLLTNFAISQTNEDDKFNPFKVDEKMKYYNKDGYEIDMKYSFENVYNACIKAVEELGCQVMNQSYSQTDAGLYKGKVFSDYCVFVGQTDTTLDEMQRYSVKIPVIRGGVWINGRMQYKFILTELENGDTHLKLKGEISGREDYVTARVHFWESCGIFEKRILDRIEELLQQKKYE